MPAVQVSKDELKKLFVHGVPPTAQPADLLQFFEACTCACPAVEGDLTERRGKSFSVALQQCAQGCLQPINVQCKITTGFHSWSSPLI